MNNTTTEVWSTITEDYTWSANVSLESGKEELTLVTWIGCGITCLACLFTVMIYIGYRLLQSARCMIRISFLSMLCTCEACYVAGMKYTEVPAICTAMALLLHFSCISTFSWLLGYILFLGNELKGGFHALSVGIYAMIGYAVPACIVVITLIWRYTDYRDDEFCWISSEGYLDWTLKGPIILLTVISVIILSYVMTLYCSVKDENQKLKLHLTMSGLRACCVLVPVTGATWILGAFTVTERYIWLQGLFTASNIVLALVILLFMCLFNQEVQNMRKVKSVGFKTLKEKKIEAQERAKMKRDREGGQKMRATAVSMFMTADQLRRHTAEPSRSDAYRPVSTTSHDSSCLSTDAGLQVIQPSEHIVEGAGVDTGQEEPLAMSLFQRTESKDKTTPLIASMHYEDEAAPPIATAEC